ncbi:cupin domain-containing protein [Paracoccus sp. PS-1]|uniref:helix-turn-helix domain-containing protein n=1 Tax=unclassified Paracoccus (in: a-proteobacteria) TaxID=2688777 RepID=UPI00048C6BDE|nr:MULTISPECIES: cupin domain-containing protein [unclassified Paracoccus (in: a-proteobacteria)]MDQ7263604.1 cupin domain-containing protein [Paracoccus sp. PS1]RQP05843.1 MAG: cupin domain-containing protein [Paracoccus sp. BP8]UFM67200.1 cupin domain-containing protein [Paracoccus sp. MA]
MDRIGQDIRALRKARGMTIAECAGRLDRSVGWLSQVERGVTAPSVQDLGRIALLFDLNISFFFRSAARQPEEQGLIVRAADRSRIGSADTGLSEELLSPGLTGGFEMIRSVFAPGSKSEGIRPAREKEDGGVVISGRLVLQIGGRRFALGPGDSFQFRGAAYAWENPGDEPAEVIWIVSPPIY